MYRSQMVALSIFVSFLVSCGSPAFMSDERRFQPEPELIQELEPYLESWATQSIEISQPERASVGERLDVSIGILDWRQPNLDHSIRVITIGVEALGDWSRGYLYVHEGIELSPQIENWQLRRLDERLYIFNYVD
jgi:hypothetical protein